MQCDWDRQKWINTNFFMTWNITFVEQRFSSPADSRIPRRGTSSALLTCIVISRGREHLSVNKQAELSSLMSQPRGSR